MKTLLSMPILVASLLFSFSGQAALVFLVTSAVAAQPTFADIQGSLRVSRYAFQCFFQESLGSDYPDRYIANLWIADHSSAIIPPDHNLFQVVSEDKAICDKTEALLLSIPSGDHSTEITVPVEVTASPITISVVNDVTGSVYAPRAACFEVTVERVTIRTKNDLVLTSQIQRRKLLYYGYCR